MPPIQLRVSNTPGARPASLLDGERAINQADVIEYFKDSSGNIRGLSLVWPNHIEGLAIKNNAGNPNNAIDISPGWCTDRAIGLHQPITLLSPLTKNLASAWAVGNNNGALDTGSVGNLSYHWWLIKRLDTGVVDALASLSNGASSTVTMTIASPCVVTWTDHGFQAGTPFTFSTTGALPTGVTAGTQYYVLSTSLTVNTFRFSATQGGAAVASSGTQSGTHTGTSTPIMPANYTLRRRFASLRRGDVTTGVNRLITQAGDLFSYIDNAPSDFNTSTAYSKILTATAIPIGIRAQAHIAWYFAISSGNGVCTQAWYDPSGTNIVYAWALEFASEQTGGGMILPWLSNHWAQYQSSQSIGGSAVGNSNGNWTTAYVDRRGQDGDL